MLSEAEVTMVEAARRRAPVRARTATRVITGTLVFWPPPEYVEDFGARRRRNRNEVTKWAKVLTNGHYVAVRREDVELL